MSAIPEHMLGVGEVNDAQDDEAKEDVKSIMKTFYRYKRCREKYDKNWLHYYKIFRGDQWAGIKMPRHRQREIINMVWTTVQASVPLQTDVRPKFTFIPTEPMDRPLSEVLNKVADADWDRNNWLVEISEAIIDGYLYGIGYGELGYDKTLEYGLGSVTLDAPDPFYCYPDPDATDVNCRNSKGFFVAEPVDTEKLKAKYPEWKGEIKPDVQDIIKSSKTSINDVTYRTAATDRDMPDVTFRHGGEPLENKTLLITAYLKPDETEECECEELGPDGQPIVKVVVKKRYPFGRRVVIANGIKLEEGPLPFAHGQFPFARYLNYILPREFFGVSEVEQLESPQRIFNKILNAQLEILNLMGNPVWIVDTAAGVNPEKLVNRTGLVVEKEPGSEVRREIGVQLSPSALNLAQLTETWFNNIAGTQDVSRGQTPGSVTAASAIEQLQEAARTRIRQKQRNLDAFIRQLGQQYVEVVLEKYDKNRVFRTTNDKGGTEYFKFRTEKVLGEGGEQQIKAIVREYNEDPEGNLIPGEIKEFLVTGRFDVKVNTGSDLPFVQADKEAKTYALFDRGIIDPEEVLDRLNVPNKEKILDRLRQREEQAIAAAQQQGAVPTA